MSNRDLTHIIRELFPSHLKTGDADLLVLFIEEYYKWMQESGNVSDLYRSMSELSDIDSAVNDFFEDLRLEYLPRIPAETATKNKATLIKQIRELYRAKGSIKSIESLFRILYDTEINIAVRSDESRQARIRVESADPDFRTKLLGRQIEGLIGVFTTGSGTGTFEVGETVQQGGGPTARVLSWDGTILIVTEMAGGTFGTGTNITQTTGTGAGDYTVTDFSDESFGASIAEIEALGATPTEVYDLLLKDLTFNNPDSGYNQIYINLHIQTNDILASQETFNNVGLISSITITDSGTEYSASDYSDENDFIPLSGGDGADAELRIREVYTNRISLPGDWSFNADPAKLDYAETEANELEKYLFTGNVLEVDGEKYNIIAVSYDQHFVELDAALSGTEDLTKVFKSFADDNRRIEAIEIINPGYKYTTAPTIDLSTLNDVSGSDATAVAVLGGSYDEFAFVEKKDAYSYIIQSDIPVSQYINVLKKTVHPAGFRVTGEFVDFPSFEETTTDLSLRMYKTNPIDYINPNNPTAGRAFFDILVGHYSQYLSAVDEYYDSETIGAYDSQTIESIDRRLSIRSQPVFTDVVIEAA